MKSSLLLAVMACLLISTGCIGPPKDRVNEEGPWYSEDVRPIYKCSNYYKPQATVGAPLRLRWDGVGWQEHTVPIVCGIRDGQCGVVNCDCICHK